MASVALLWDRTGGDEILLGVFSSEAAAEATRDAYDAGARISWADTYPDEPYPEPEYAITTHLIDAVSMPGYCFK